MFAQDYIERLKAMVAELEAHPDIEVEEFTLNPPATDDQIEAAKAYGGLTADMEDFYRTVNGFNLRWSYVGDRTAELQGDPDNPYSLMGTIRIWPVQYTFKDQRDLIYFDDDDKFKPLHPLDYFVDEACAAIYLDGTDDPQVWYHYCGEEMSTLKMSFRQYLEALLKSRGFWYWHRSVAAPEYFNPYHPMSHSEQGFRSVMPHLFADYNDNDFLRVDGYRKDGAAADGGEAEQASDEGGGDEGGGLDLSKISVTFTTGGPPPKNKMMALVLAVFLGVFGAHRFYLGKIGTGVLMLLTFGGCGIWPWIDVILIAMGKMKDSQGRDLA